MATPQPQTTPTTSGAQPQSPTPPETDRLNPVLWLMLAAIVFTLLTVWFAQVHKKHVADHPQQTPPVTTTTSTNSVSPFPPTCDNALARMQAGVGDHRNEEDIDHFDVNKNGGCFGEWIYPPHDWNRWEYEVSSGTQCQVWFWFYGNQKPLGPYREHALPDFPITGYTKWQIATNCDIRYWRKA
jgi:hypothetical protein